MLSTVVGFPEGMNHSSISVTETTDFSHGLESQ